MTLKRLMVHVAYWNFNTIWYHGIWPQFDGPFHPYGTRLLRNPCEKVRVFSRALSPYDRKTYFSRRAAYAALRFWSIVYDPNFMVHLVLKFQI